MSSIRIKSVNGQLGLSPFPLFAPWDWFAWVKWKVAIHRYKRLKERRDAKRAK